MTPKEFILNKEDILTKALQIFTGHYTGELATKVVETFENGLIDPEFPMYKKYYSKWSIEKTQLLVDTIHHIVAKGYAIGSKNDREAVAIIANDFIGGNMGNIGKNPVVPQATPKKIKMLKIKGALTAGIKNSAITRYAKATTSYMSRSKFAEAMLGFANLTGKDDQTAKALAVALKDHIRDEAIALIAGEPRPYEKQPSYWEKYTPNPLPLSMEEGVKVACEPPYWLGGLLNLPQVEQAICDKAILGLFEDLKAESETLKHEEALIEEWHQQRPQTWSFANAATTDYIKFNYKGIDKNEALQAVWISRMAGFRILDAHITGVQQIEDQQTSGIPLTFKKLQFDLGDLPEAFKAEMEKPALAFVKIGKVISAEYGQKKNGTIDAQRILERAIFECRHPGSDQDRKFNYDHFVAQYSKLVAPILFMTPLKVKQKNLGSIELIHKLYSLAANTPELDMPETRSPILVEPPDDFVRSEAISQNWMSQDRVSPQQLEFIGLAPYQHKNVTQALELTKTGIPEFAVKVEAKLMVEALKQQLIENTILAPVIAQGVQREVVRIYQKLLDPAAAQVQFQQIQDKYSGHQLAEVQSRGEAFDIALKYIGDPKHKQNQERALKVMTELYQVSEKTRNVRTVTAPEAINWNKHQTGDLSGSIPTGWILLDEHIKDMQKDGLSDRTIKMAGVRSIVDEEERLKVLSRNGKSATHAGMLKNGVLLIYPNPLISEAHSKTENPEKKYVAPDGSCNPPMLIPVQARVVTYNKEFLSRKHDDISEQEVALKRLRDHEQKIDLNNYTTHFLESGFEPVRAKNLAEMLYAFSTSSKLYQAMEDDEADIEITEGQKKAYKMYQSYKELIEAEDEAFVAGLSPAMDDQDIKNLSINKPNRKNRIFICSPGVWLPVKSWEKFKPEEKAEICKFFSVEDKNGKASPLNPATKYCLTPSWAATVPMNGRLITITYDSDAKDNPNVAQSVSAMAQAIKDAFPDTKIAYRLITPKNGIEKKGADDYLVAFGNKPFYDELEVSEIAPNIGFKEIVSEGPKAGSLIHYLIQKQQEHKQQEPDLI